MNGGCWATARQGFELPVSPGLWIENVSHFILSFSIYFSEILYWFLKTPLNGWRIRTCKWQLSGLKVSDLMFFINPDGGLLALLLVQNEVHEPDQNWFHVGGKAVTEAYKWDLWVCLEQPQMATLDHKPAPRARSCSHCELTRDVSPRATLNLGRRGTPTPPSHPFLTVRFPLVLPVCTCFLPSLSVLSRFPSLPPEDLTFFPLASHCVLTGAFVTRVCDRTQSTLSFSLSLSLFRRSPHL